MKQKSTFFLAMSGLSFLLFGLLTTLVLLVDVVRWALAAPQWDWPA